jgi:hypothetical protein
MGIYNRLKKCSISLKEEEEKMAPCPEQLRQKNLDFIAGKVEKSKKI